MYIVPRPELTTEVLKRLGPYASQFSTQELITHSRDLRNQWKDLFRRFSEAKGNRARRALLSEVSLIFGPTGKSSELLQTLNEVSSFSKNLDIQAYLNEILRELRAEGPSSLKSNWLYSLAETVDPLTGQGQPFLHASFSIEGDPVGWAFQFTEPSIVSAVKKLDQSGSDTDAAHLIDLMRVAMAREKPAFDEICAQQRASLLLLQQKTLELKDSAQRNDWERIDRLMREIDQLMDQVAAPTEEVRNAFRGV
jgi:hypothetical protein